MDKRLAQHAFLAGDEYTIADMASYPWIGAYDKLPVDFAAFPNLKRWHEAIAARRPPSAPALRQQVNPNASRSATKSASTCSASADPPRVGSLATQGP